MGKFDGVLLYTDYDDTLYNHHRTVSEENHRAIRYFMAEGGRFSIATGRAKRTFAPQIAKEHLEFNAPVVVGNGAGIYDFHADRYVLRTQLGQDAPRHMDQLCSCYPGLSFEAYHGDDIYVHHPNPVTLRHLERVGVPYRECAMEEMPTPWTKAIFQQQHDVLLRVQRPLRPFHPLHHQKEIQHILPHGGGVHCQRHAVHRPADADLLAQAVQIGRLLLRHGAS